MPDQSGDHANRQFWDLQRLAGPEIQHAQAAQTIFIENVSEQLAVSRQPGTLHVPTIVCEISRFATCDGQQSNTQELVITIGRDIDSFAITRKANWHIS